MQSVGDSASVRLRLNHVEGTGVRRSGRAAVSRSMAARNSPSPCFVAQSVLGLKLETIYRGIIPFVIIYLIALGLITYIPEISLIGVKYLLARG